MDVNKLNKEYIYIHVFVYIFIYGNVLGIEHYINYYNNYYNNCEIIILLLEDFDYTFLFIIYSRDHIPLDIKIIEITSYPIINEFIVILHVIIIFI